MADFVFEPPLRLVRDVTVRTLDDAAEFARTYVGPRGLLGVEILARLSAGGAANVQRLAWRFGFVGAMLVNLKQANPVLLALVTAGLVLVALRDPAIRTRRALVQLP